MSYVASVGSNVFAKKHPRSIEIVAKNIRAYQILIYFPFQGSEDIDLTKYIDSKANMTLIRLMVDPFSPECALNESEISLTNAIYYDVFRIINGTTSEYPTASDKDKISRSDIRKQVKTVNVHFFLFCLVFTLSPS